MKTTHWPWGTPLTAPRPRHLGLGLPFSPTPSLQPQVRHFPCVLAKPLSKPTSLFSGSLTAPHPSSRSHHLYLIRDLRTKRDPGACKREVRWEARHECPLPLRSSSFSNSPRPRQDTRRPDFPRFLQGTEAAGRGGASIKGRDYPPPAPLLPQWEALRVSSQSKGTRPSGRMALGSATIAEQINDSGANVQRPCPS